MHIQISVKLIAKESQEAAYVSVHNNVPVVVCVNRRMMVAEVTTTMMTASWMRIVGMAGMTTAAVAGMTSMKMQTTTRIAEEAEAGCGMSCNPFSYHRSGPVPAVRECCSPDQLAACAQLRREWSVVIIYIRVVGVVTNCYLYQGCWRSWTNRVSRSCVTRITRVHPVKARTEYY